MKKLEINQMEVVTGENCGTTLGSYATSTIGVIAGVILVSNPIGWALVGVALIGNALALNAVISNGDCGTPMY